MVVMRRIINTPSLRGKLRVRILESLMPQISKETRKLLFVCSLRVYVSTPGQLLSAGVFYMVSGVL